MSFISKTSILTKRINEFNRDDILESLSGIKRGFEKESLRTDENGMLANTMHPKALGSSLKNTLITTDYSESLLEFITPPTTDIAELFNTLTELHQYTHRVLENGFLWNGSMPCRLPPENEIPIAYYGTSNLGKLKTIYRLGLGLRYGRRMQMISGVHYNFSFSLRFWERYASLKQDTIRQETIKQENRHSLPRFISEHYLGMIRNAQRLGWILPFLFGSSPAVCSSFFQNEMNTNDFHNMGTHTLFLPEATSLRLSDLGYQNKVKPLVNVSYNSFSEFLTTMHQAVHTPDPQFSRFGVKKNGEYQQLSDCVLQIEDEHYAMFRPKRVTAMDERMLAALQREGIEYIEIRALDNNPFFPLGVNPEIVYIIDAFLVLCLLLDSPRITEEEDNIIRHNHALVVKEGRNRQLKLISENGHSRRLTDWAQEILSHLENIAELLDVAYGVHHFSEAIQKALMWVQDPNLLPSAKIIAELQDRGESYREFMIRNSKQAKEYFRMMDFPNTKQHYYAELAKQTILEQTRLEQSESMPFDDYLKNFLIA